MCNGKKTCCEDSLLLKKLQEFEERIAELEEAIHDIYEELDEDGFTFELEDEDETDESEEDEEDEDEEEEDESCGCK